MGIIFNPWLLSRKKLEGKEVIKVNIDNKSSITYTSIEKIKKIIEKKESFVWNLVFSEFPWCRSVVSTLLEVEKDLGLDTIYYLNIKEIRNQYKIVDN